MKIITILGSPRKKGNTAAVLSSFEKLVEGRHQVERINLTDYIVKGCLGCDACQKTGSEPGCRQIDDFLKIYEKMLASDVIIYATPLYAWGFTAQMKALIDRHYCLIKWNEGIVVNALIEGKRAALLVTCGDKPENNADLIQVVFDREMAYLRCQNLGALVVPECTTPDQMMKKGQTAAQELVRLVL